MSQSSSQSALSGLKKVAEHQEETPRRQQVWRKTKTERSGFMKICKEEINLEKPASDTGVFVFHHVERVSDMLKCPIL